MKSILPICAALLDSQVPNSRRVFREEQAFTLLDLLAILFSVALLCALVLPAVARSGDAGRRTICTNNLRQMGAASTMYANDNQDYLAYPNWGSVLPGWLYMPTNGTVPDPSPTGSYSNNPTAAYSTGLWFQYVRNPASYLCPVDLESKYYSQRINKLCSYVMNGAVSGFGRDTTTCKVTDVWNPACYLLWGADEGALNSGVPIGSLAFNDGSEYPGSGGEQPERLHTANGAEIVSVGGDVRFVLLQKFLAESAYTGTPQQPKGLAWWAPFTSNGH
jgi:type II secretory pathway pseudopilin PulG